MGNEADIVIIDDHSLFLRGIYGIIKRVMHDRNIECFESISDFTASNPSINAIELLISDIEIPGEKVFSFLENLRNDYPKLPILVITMHKKLSVIKKCKELGISGYLLKDDDDLLLDAIFASMNGEEFYSPRVEKLFKSYSQQLNFLSPREEEIIKLIGLGKGNKDIAEELYVSIETVKSHKKNIKTKLGIDGSSDLVKYALDHYVI